MNVYNPLDSTKRLEAAGLTRQQAEAIGSERGDGTSSLVVKEQLEAALDKVTIRLSVIIAGVITLACTVLGVVLSHH
ncbi:hypothetical protein [uncultured Sphingomonas sp.]|uniref:hypothetical protein n=1 Tax=uncultured Sphingomonas sp. TaxID=158754 RepID=UPI0035CC0048